MDMNGHLTVLILYLLAASAHYLCKPIGPRSGPTELRTLTDLKLFESDIFLKR